MNELNTRVEVCDLMGGYDMQFPVIFFVVVLLLLLKYVGGSRAMVWYFCM